MNDHPISPAVLLVEDDPADVELTLTVFARVAPHVKVDVARGGTDALGRLSAPATARPALILLDINMPVINGFEVLRHLKGDPRLQMIPVVMLTTSQAAADTHRAYALGANAFVTKAVDLADYEWRLRGLIHFWLEIAGLPA